LEAAYLYLFETLRKGFGLLQRDPKMVFSRRPLTCSGRGDTFEAFLTYRASENGYSKADAKLGSIEDPRDPGQ
jgi:hypothetical protein